MLISRKLWAVCVAGALSLLAGCAGTRQQAIPMNGAALAGSSRIGVAMTPLPKVDTYLPGAGCLLCMAAASMANSSLTTHAHTLPSDDLSVLKTTVADRLRAGGADVVLISEAIKLDDLPKNAVKGDNLAAQNFSSLQKKHGIDKLLLIDITQLGFERTYSAYIATGAPYAVMRGSGSLIDLKTLLLEWYSPLSVVRSAEGAWDEPPKFPGLTNAYFQVIELGKDELLTPFKP